MNGFLPQLHWTNLLIIPGLLIGYTIHELAHALAAYFFGDTSQVERGKFTLNPFRHISWLGSIAFLLIGIGWADPLEISPQNYKNRWLALTFTALAGPLVSLTFGLTTLLFTLLMAAVLVYNSNLATDTILQFFFPIVTENRPQAFDMQALAIAFTSKVAVASFWIGFTSLLPLPRMDGFVALIGLVSHYRSRKMPQPQAVPKATRPTANMQSRIIPVDQYTRRNNVADIHFKLGTEYHQTNKFDDAIARYRQAIANDQNFGPAYVNLGLAYLGKGKRREAIHAFRGAIQFADDQKSHQEAWYQLHQLSEVTPIDDHAEESLSELGASPWTDTKPKPNWPGLAVSAALLLLAGIAFYSYLFAGLAQMLQG